MVGLCVMCAGLVGLRRILVRVSGFALVVGWLFSVRVVVLNLSFFVVLLILLWRPLF